MLTFVEGAKELAVDGKEYKTWDCYSLDYQGSNRYGIKGEKIEGVKIKYILGKSQYAEGYKLRGYGLWINGEAIFAESSFSELVAYARLQVIFDNDKPSEYVELSAESKEWINSNIENMSERGSFIASALRCFRPSTSFRATEDSILLAIQKTILKKYEKLQRGHDMQTTLNARYYWRELAGDTPKISWAGRHKKLLG